MSAPDFKRICGACIFAAVAANKSAPVLVASEDDDNDNPTPAVEEAPVLWNDLDATEQLEYINVAGFLHQFAGSGPIATMDCALAGEAVFTKFGVGWAATAVQIFKNVVQEFGHI